MPSKRRIGKFVKVSVLLFFLVFFFSEKGQLFRFPGDFGGFSTVSIMLHQKRSSACATRFLDSEGLFGLKGLAGFAFLVIFYF